MARQNDQLLGRLALLFGMILLITSCTTRSTDLPSPATPTSTPMTAPSVSAAPSSTPTPNLQAEFVRYEERAAWRAFLGWPDDCEEGFERFEHEPDDAGGIVTYPVADGQYIAFVTCNIGPYWEEQRAYWLDYRTSPPATHPLSVPVLIQDDAPQLGLQAVDTLSGAYPMYHPEAQTLTNLHAYRGFKDCGVYYKYHLEEGNFVLDEARFRDCEDTMDNALSYEEWTLVYPSSDSGGQAVLFREVAPLPSDLQGEITALESLPDGALRLLTTSGYSLFQDGVWQSYFLAASQRFIGVQAAAPQIDWLSFSRDFVASYGLEPNLVTTQILPYDNWIRYFNLLQLTNSILIDFSQDMWRFISDGILKQAVIEGEVGSSTMPQKVNPIDFENAEGNLGVANALFAHYAQKLPVSRLQRDLSDSTVRRTFGTALGHSLLAYVNLARGMGRVVADEEKLKEELNAHWEVVAEGAQTILRAAGRGDAYESLMRQTRGRVLTESGYRSWCEALNVDEETRGRLLGLSPESYIGLAVELTDRVIAGL